MYICITYTKLGVILYILKHLDDYLHLTKQNKPYIYASIMADLFSLFAQIPHCNQLISTKLRGERLSQ